LDPRIELMQRQAQYAIEQQPENKELILKALSEDMGAVAMEWTEQANLAITNNNTKEYRAKVTEALKKDLLDNGFNAGEDFQIPPIPGKDFNGKVAAGSASTAEPSYEQDKFDGETEEEYYDRKEREGQRLAQETGVSATRQRIADERGALSQMGRLGADLEAAGKGAYSNLVRGAGAAVGIGAGVGDVLMPGDWYSEAGFDAQKAMQEHAANVDSSISPLASENARMGGEIVGSLLTFPVAPFQRGQDALDKGKSLGRAELALGEEALIQELGLATGKLGSQAKGFVPYLTRAGAQVPANVALGAGSRALAGEDYTKQDLILDAAMGAGGGIFRDAPAVNPRLSSLEEAFKAGEDSVLPPEMEKRPTLWEGSSDPVSIDINKPFTATFEAPTAKTPSYGIAPTTTTTIDSPPLREIADAPPVREALMEEAGNAAGSRDTKAIQRELADYTKQARLLQDELDGLPEHKAWARELEDEYLEEDLRVHGEEGAFSPELTKLRQNSADAEAARLREAKRTSIAEQQASVADRLQRAESEAARIAGGNAALDQLRRVERTGEPLPSPVPPRDLSGVASQAAFPPQEGVAVSHTPTPEALPPVYPERGQEYSYKTKYNPNTLTAKIEAKLAPKAKPVHTVESLTKLLENDDAPSFLVMERAHTSADGTQVAATRAPDHILQKLADDTLTADDVIKEYSKKSEGDTQGKRESASLTSYLGALADRIGGRGVNLTILDPANEAHAAVLDRNKMNMDSDFSAFYDGATNRIYLKPTSKGGNTLIHEVAHGVTSKLLTMGENGDLSGPAQTAYVNFADSWERFIRPKLKENAEALGKDHPDYESRTYGLGDKNAKTGLMGAPHEAVAEFFGSAAFRQSLKEMKLDPKWVATLPAPLRGLARKAANVYDLVVNNLSSLLGKAGIRSMADLGMANKATNAYEAWFGHMDKFFNAVDDVEASALRERSKFNTTKDEAPDTSFLGEQVAYRGPSEKAMPEGESAIKHKPLGKVGTFLKAAWAGKGVNSRVTLAKERLAGNKQEARVTQIANINKARTLVGELKGVSRASAMKDMSVIFKDAASDDAKKAMASLRGTSPELAGFVSKLATDNWKGATDLAKALIKSQEGKKLPDQKILNFAAKLLENRGKYSYRAYGDSAAQKTKFKLANKAAAKAKAGKTLTNEETKALTELNNLKGYIRHNIYGDAEALSKLTSPTLHGLYEDAFGNLEPLKGLSKKDAKALMIEELADYNGNMFNKDGAVDEMVETISGMNNDAAAKYYKGMKYGKDTLKARDDVPKAIRDWWGEIEDPLTRQILSRTIQSLQKAEVETLNALRTDGLADGTFSSQRGMGHKEQITGPGSGALEGLYTTPDVMAVIDSVTQFGSKAEGVYDAMVQKKSGAEGIGAAAWTIAKIPVQVMRTAKTMETVGNIGGWLRNAAGSPAQLWSNGNFINPKYTAKGINVTRKLINLAGKEDMGPEELRMIRLGLAEGTQTHETFSPRVRSKMDKLLQLMGEDPNEAISWLRTLKDSGGASVDFLKEAYGAVDLWPKMANFYYEHDFQSAYNKRHGIKMDPDELDRQVADRVKQTNITYSRSPAALKLIESAGVTRFVNYYYETFRTSANNIGIGLSDFAKGLKEKDVQLASHGARRVVGTVGAVNYTTALYAAGLKASAGALGYVAAEAGDALTDYMEDDSFMDPESTVLVSDGNKKYGLDAGMIAPLDPVDSVVKNMIRAAFDPENAEKHIGKATENAFNLLSNNSMIAGAIKALQGRQPAMAKTDPKLYEQILGWNEANTGLKPETVDAFINTLSPLIPKTPKEVSRGLNTDADPKIKEAIGSGVGMYEINPEKDIKTYLGRSFKLETGEARKAYSSLLSKPIDVTPERLEKAFKEGMLQLAKPYAKLERAYKAALEEGSDKDDLLDAIEAKVSGDVVDMLEDGALLPAKLIYMDMSSQAEQAIEDAEEKDKAKVEERWYKKLDALDDILYKYEDMTLEDIEKGALDG